MSKSESRCEICEKFMEEPSLITICCLKIICSDCFFSNSHLCESQECQGFTELSTNRKQIC